jgi:hypothetical protein
MQEKTKKKTNMDQLILRMAGVFVLISLTLGYFWSGWFYLITAFVGLNMLQASFTGICPAVKVFRLLGIQYGSAFGGK